MNDSWFGEINIVIWVAILAIALFAGYLWGLSEGKKSAVTKTGQPEIQVDTGYQNPFEGVKFNPFK